MSAAPSVSVNKQSASESETAGKTGIVNCPIHKGFWIQRPIGNTLWGDAKCERRECPGCVTDLAVKASQMSVSSGSTVPETVFSAPAPKSQLGQPNVVDLFVDDEDFSGHYTGEMKDKKRHGTGTFKFNQGSRNGNVYEGEWVKDVMQGRGKYTNADGNVYEGEFRNDLRNGVGKTTFANGNSHEGEYKDDKRHGKGTYTWASSNIYIGDFVDNKMCGQGRYTYAKSGDVYEGEYRDDKKHGIGKYSYASGNVYEGQYVNGDKSGHGKYTWVNGDVFEGEYVDDKKNGPGVMTYASGTVKTGMWKLDKFVEA